MMMSEDDFYSLVENSNHKELRLYVYNIETDVCREVSDIVWYAVHHTHTQHSY